jgi:predicted RNA-binding protein YlqC (UPF0109 family)
LLYRLCELLVHSLIERPERVDIFFLHVAESDRGRLLGKGGRTIDALRLFLEAAAVRVDREVVVEIIE